MPEVKDIVSTFVLISFLIFFAIHIIYKEKMRGPNLIFAVISILLFGCGVLIMIWNPFNLRTLDALPIAIITIGTASGFIFAAYKFDANNEQTTGKDIANKEDEQVVPDDERASRAITGSNRNNGAVGPNVVVHADNFIANAHLNSTAINLQSTEINSQVIKSTSISDTKNTVTNNETTNNSTLNNTYNNIISKETPEESSTSQFDDTATANSNNESEDIKDSDIPSIKQDYLSSKTEAEKDFIKKYVKYEFRNRPIIESITRYFDMYRSSKDKDTFVLQAFYCARLACHWLTMEPSRADYIKIWGSEHLGGKSAYSEAKGVLDNIEVTKVNMIGKKLKDCLTDVERELGLEKDVE